METKAKLRQSYVELAQPADVSELLKLADAFDAGYDAAKPQWISVKDRLPAINEWVIGYYSMWYESDKQWLGPVRRYEHPRRKATQWFIADANNEGDNEEAKSVSHWMPLPKPPETI